MTLTIDALDMHYKDLNQLVKKELRGEVKELVLKNINGHRYIANALQGNSKIIIEGVPGNDLAVFMDGPSVTVNGNIQDICANTMNEGLLVVHGSAGDVLGYGMRGGEIYIQKQVGYRAAIHMKEYGPSKPIMIIGETAGDFLGEYMAGGLVLVLNIKDEECAVGAYCGSGMHGGQIIVRGDLEKHRKYIKSETSNLDDSEISMVKYYSKKYEEHFNISLGNINKNDYFKIQSSNLRPYKKLYVGV